MKSKALVWGNGKSAYTVANYVRTELSASMDCVGFYVSNCKILNKDVNEPVYTMDEVVSDNNEIADVLIIPNPGKKISDILFEHRTIKNKRILFVSAENIRRPNKAKYFFEISGKKPWLNGFEYHVVDHCNLNCKGCGHCANLFNAPSFGDIDVYERDLKRLSELFEGVGLIRLLGGEPLLKETFEGIRRGVSFEEFCNNIRLLHALQPSLELRFNVVCMRQNIVEMPQIIELAAELGVSAVGISGLIAQKVLDNLEDEIRLYPKVATYYLKEAINRADALGIKMLQFPEYVFKLESEKTFEEELYIINSKPFYHTEEFQEELYQRYRKMDVVKPTEQASLSEYAQKSIYQCAGICDYIVESPFVGVTGEVTTCCIDGIHIMGDLKQDSFTAIWNNEIYRRMREMFFEDHLPKYCVGCMFLKDHTNVKRMTLTNVDADFFEHKFSDLLDTSDSED